MRAMRWLELHAWWGLLATAVLMSVFGLTDVASGAAADPAIPLGLTGMTLEELQAEGPTAVPAIRPVHARERNQPDFDRDCFSPPCWSSPFGKTGDGRGGRCGCCPFGQRASSFSTWWLACNPTSPLRLR